MSSPASIPETAMELAKLTREAGIVFRLFGSCGVYFKCTPHLEIWQKNSRSIKDIDAVVKRGGVNPLREWMQNNDWEEQVELTAMSDGNRLRFAKDRSTLDVVVDCLHFNQRLDLADRLNLDWPTISITDLLLSKLQIQSPSKNDLVDMATILCRYDLVQDDESKISLRRIQELSSSSWRWHRAISAASSYLRTAFASEALILSPEEKRTVEERLGQLENSMGQVQKSVTWQMRKFVGDSVPWYDPVEPI